MPAPAVVSELVDRFERNLDAYRGGRYNETQVRREFLDPFFKALGWGVDNEEGYAEAYTDVVHEDAIKVRRHEPTALAWKLVSYRRQHGLPG